MSISIKNKVALVTGANRGIGKAIVESFLNHGAKKVYLAVRRPESAKELEEKYGDRVVTLQADVTDADSIKRIAQQATDLEILVSNAGVYHASSPFEADTETNLIKEMAVNVYGFLRLTTAFSDILIKNKGALVQINSTASLKSIANGFFTYSPSKAASYSLTQGFHQTLGKQGVAVLSVHPGPTATEMGAKAGFKGEGVITPSVVSEEIVEALGTGQFHLFSGPLAKQIEGVYKGFAENIIEADLVI